MDMEKRRGSACRSRSQRVLVAVLSAAAGLATLFISSPVIAQKKASGKVTAPKNITLTTKDGVSLACTYYRGGHEEQTVPVILVHGWGGVRGEFDGLATFLQKTHGHAVIVPDLRGHGGSTKLRGPNGQELTIDPKRMRNSEVQGMVRFDLEAVKKFLLKEHNEKNLNIELLCLVGSEMGAIVGLNWAVRDWSWPQLPAYKQGQDVKAYVLISPQQSFKGMRIQPGLVHQDVRRLAAMILVGEGNPKAYSSAKSIHSRLKRFHSLGGRNKDKQVKDLFMPSIGTSLQGTKLLTPKSLQVQQIIAKFIELSLVKKQEVYPWAERISPLGR